MGRAIFSASRSRPIWRCNSCAPNTFSRLRRRNRQPRQFVHRLILRATPMHPYQHSTTHDTLAHNCRILKNIDDVVSIRTEWDRLWVDARAGYLLSFSYFYESWNTILRPQGAELCCVVSCDNGRLLAALPMVLLR